MSVKSKLEEHAREFLMDKFPFDDIFKVKHQAPDLYKFLVDSIFDETLWVEEFDEWLEKKRYGGGTP